LLALPLLASSSLLTFPTPPRLIQGLAPELMVMGIGVVSQEAKLVEEKRVSGERGAASAPPPFATAMITRGTLHLERERGRQFWSAGFGI